MTTYSQNTLKTFFQTGDVPTGSDYANLIDSCLNIVDTSAQSIAGPINPTELITARVSAGNIIATGTLSVTASAGLTLTNQGDGAAGQTGTLNTAPTAGDPAIWLPVNINGTIRFIPAW